MEINLLSHYPKANRNLQARSLKTPEDSIIARQFDREFFDGERRHGYGGFVYNPKYWEHCIPDFAELYELKSGSKILDVGCARGFMLYDFMRLIPGINVRGVDISQYAIRTAKEEVEPFLSVADARDLPFKDKAFHLGISINTIHNLTLDGVVTTLRELSRVSDHQFVVVDAYRDEEEKKRMLDWNLTAKTILSVEEWKEVFKAAHYEGDYYWFTP